MTLPTTQEILNGIVYPGVKWSGSTITYSVAGPNSTWIGYPEYGPDWKEYYGNEPKRPGFGYLNDAQADKFRSLMESVQKLVAVRLVETNDALQPGDIRVAFVDASPWGGYAYYPPWAGDSPSPQNGDIFMDDEWVPRTFEVGTNFDKGQASQPSVLHEIGHALGLKHNSEDPGRLPAKYDNTRYTIMTYSIFRDMETLTFYRSGNTLTYTNTLVLVDSFMIFDILGLQTLYGANPGTASGNDVYSWAETPFMKSIYDAAGHDTFNLSSHTRPSYVDLTPGSYSSIAIHTREAQQAYWVAKFPEFEGVIREAYDKAVDPQFYMQLYTGKDNLGIAFSTVIEDVVAGSGSDTLIGNAAANMLNGNAGDDRILAGEGADTLIGGDGQDFLRGEVGDDSLSGGAGFDDMHGNMGADTLYGGLGGDWVVGGQHADVLYGDDGDDLVYGNMGQDLLYGGAGADTMLGGQDNDTLDAGAGADFLSGDRGNDVLRGGAGADTFYAFLGSGVDRVLDFSRLEGDRVVVAAGVVYSVGVTDQDIVVSLEDGTQIILVGQPMPTGDWIGYL